ncbi:hypothetical protein NC651_010585 [Populus alba x Populus x berolinensis]|nr:hypothetical protein NC651_010585 [Populus alba x Populus x berolinensis]
MAARPSGSDDHQLGDYPHEGDYPFGGGHSSNSCRYVPGSLSKCRIGGPPV